MGVLISLAVALAVVRGWGNSPNAGVRRELDRGLDDAVGHRAVSYRSYSMLSRKLSTRCLRSVAALSS
jgi:hypothetical protein